MLPKFYTFCMDTFIHYFLVFSKLCDVNQFILPQIARFDQVCIQLYCPHVNTLVSGPEISEVNVA